MSEVELFEVIVVDGGQRWHAGWLVDDENETDRLLTEDGRVLLFGARAGLEHYAQEHELDLDDDLPDEVDLDLGGWLPTGAPLPPVQDVSQLWHLLIDDPVAGRPLEDESLSEAYDDMVEETPGWFEEHGDVVRRALSQSVTALRGTFRTV